MLRKLRSKLIFQGLVAMDTIWFEFRYHKSSHGNCFQSTIVVKLAVHLFKGNSLNGSDFFVFCPYA